MYSIRFLACVVIAEAILNRNAQIDVLELINQIDLNLDYKLRLQINYKQQQFRNNVSAGLWLFAFFICVILNAVLLHLNGTDREERFWFFYIIPFFICTLQYQRLLFYVPLLRHRYQILNEYFLRISETQETRRNIQAAKPDSLEPLITARQLIDFRNIYQQLYEAAVQINDMFWWSLPLCILVDFHAVLLNTYRAFLVLLTNASGDNVMFSLLWGFCNAGHLLLVSHACHSTSIMVSFKSGAFSKNNLLL